MLDIETEIFRGVMFVRIKGELSIKTISKWNEEVKNLIDDNGITNVVFNLSLLKNIDIVGINAIVKSYEICKLNKGIVYLCHLSKNLKDKLKNNLLKNISEINNESDAISIINA